MALIATIVYFFDWENGVYLPIRVRLGAVTYTSVPGDDFLKFEAEPGVYTIEMLLPDYTFQYWGVWPEYEGAISFSDIYANPTSITINAFSRIYAIMIPEVLTEPVFVETYRDVDIYWLPALEVFRAQVAVGYVAVAATLEEIRAKIDDILAFLEPPEEPPEGLFAQVVAAVKLWILENIQPWLQQWGEVVNNWITNVVEEITNVYNYITEQITNVYNDLSTYITNVFNTINEYVTNVFNAYNEYVTNVHNTFNEYVTNIIGVSQEILDNNLVDFAAWVRGLLAELDPHKILPDPQGYIAAAFNTLIAPWVEGVVKAFWEGFEEGQA